MTIESFQLAPGVDCRKIPLGHWQANGYLVEPDDGPLVLIDAADQADHLLRLIAGRPVSTIITTHRHFDHIQALADVVEQTGARTICGQPDAGAITHATGVKCDTVWTGDQIDAGSVSFEVIGLIGHTPGSIALVMRGSDPVQIFTGDSLFPGGLGKTNDRATFDGLFTDVTSQIFDRFPDDTIVHPGHGASTTLGAERPHLDEWWTRGW